MAGCQCHHRNVANVITAVTPETKSLDMFTTMAPQVRFGLITDLRLSAMIDVSVQPVVGSKRIRARLTQQWTSAVVSLPNSGDDMRGSSGDCVLAVGHTGSATAVAFGRGVASDSVKRCRSRGTAKSRNERNFIGTRSRRR